MRRAAAYRARAGRRVVAPPAGADWPPVGGGGVVEAPETPGAEEAQETVVGAIDAARMDELPTAT